MPVLTNWEDYFVSNRVAWDRKAGGPHASFLTSDRHSDYYFNSDILNSSPEALYVVCHALQELVTGRLKEKPDWVVTYPPFGTQVARGLARLLQTNFTQIRSLQAPLFVEEIGPRQSVLFCADDFYSGQSFRIVEKAIKASGATIVTPLVVVGNFSEADSFDGLEIASLFSKNLPTWTAENCPLCASGSPSLPARRNWNALVDSSLPAKQI